MAINSRLCRNLPTMVMLPALTLTTACVGYLTATRAADAPAVKPGKPAAAAAFDMTPLQGDKRILQALNRLGFGPRPGAVDYVRGIGLEHWIEGQLSPETIDDSPVEAKLAHLHAMQMPPQRLMLAYNGDKKGKKAQKKKKTATGAAGDAATTAATMEKTDMAATTPEMPQNSSLEAVGELENAKLLRSIESRRQLQEMLVDFWSNHFNLDVKKGPVRTLKLADERDVIRPHVLGKFRDLLGASAKSPAMMFYLDNFRSTGTPARPVKPTRRPANKNGRRNGRNANRRRANTGVVLPFVAPTMPYRLTGPRLRVVHPHAVTRATVRPMDYAVPSGVASAHYTLTDFVPDAPPTQAAPAQPAPATTAPAAAPRVAVAPPAKGKDKRAGINENYARELMELHTLGVDGGYTQQDVQEVARCFTGWGFNQQTGQFAFQARRHDGGRKVVLGHVIPAGGGIRDGEQVLDILASHPSTAHFIARKLCVRLVADEPPTGLVERTAQTFLDTGGDLKAVVRTIVTSPEFFSAGAYRSKIKAPFEYAVSAVRALDGHFDAPNPDQPIGWRLLVADGAVSAAKRNPGKAGRGRTSLAQEIATMGEPMFAYQAPTGYPEDSQHWVSAGALIARLNFALALTSNRIFGVSTSATSMLGATTDHQAMVDQLGVKLLGGDVSGATRTVIARQLPAGTSVDPAKTVALMLGAPEFQRR